MDMSAKTPFKKIETDPAQAKIPTWLEKNKVALEERRKKVMQEKGLEEFYTLEEGETLILFDLTKEPRLDETGDFGMKTIFRVKIGDKPYDLSASDSLAKKIYNGLTLGYNPMTIIRVGEEKQTRYSVKELKKKKNKSA
jgi:hypothetical protein